MTLNLNENINLHTKNRPKYYFYLVFMKTIVILKFTQHFFQITMTIVTILIIIIQTFDKANILKRE